MSADTHAHMRGKSRYLEMFTLTILLKRFFILNVVFEYYYDLLFVCIQQRQILLSIIIIIHKYFCRN